VAVLAPSWIKHDSSLCHTSTDEQSEKCLWTDCNSDHEQMSSYNHMGRYRCSNPQPGSSMLLLPGSIILAHASTWTVSSSSEQRYCLATAQYSDSASRLNRHVCYASVRTRRVKTSLGCFVNDGVAAVRSIRKVTAHGGHTGELALVILDSCDFRCG